LFRGTEIGNRVSAGDMVRKTVGYDRFEGQEMCDALEEAYRCLNPLLNYCCALSPRRSMPRESTEDLREVSQILKRLKICTVKSHNKLSLSQNPKNDRMGQ
jgi:hypothetical protein